ncbi:MULTISPECIES: bifunctional 2-polyprenyl-6-hydroxyphenol methylase/3-demethylubiquinol 3-O-methyltransferase UbiG [unclassified Nocardia]|uniref:class I SAM-dependent methyltransferase n=1 Tax=unclassified Nocardia TaxID=2637762 RepID=UPI001CE3DACE|nr:MULTISPECIES: class I SAM-dependent methyltransferase [unclassified Nocardia]
MEVPDARRWNINIHFHDLVVRAVSGAADVLDIGCGEGMLARRLRREADAVTGIDLDAASIELAKAQSPGGEIDYLRADFLAHPFEPESFDGIVSVATLHHMDPERGLNRIKELLRPGGTAAVIGFARNEFPADLPRMPATVLAYAWHVVPKKQWRHPSPIVWPPPDTYRTMRKLTERVLPGARFRQHLLPRYSIVWTKPSN